MLKDTHWRYSDLGIKILLAIYFNTKNNLSTFYLDNWNAMMSFVAKTIRAVSGGELPATKRLLTK